MRYKLTNYDFVVSNFVCSKEYTYSKNNTLDLRLMVKLIGQSHFNLQIVTSQPPNNILYASRFLPYYINIIWRSNKLYIELCWGFF
jgi:hypothetical protein